jgi:MFS family permease
MAGGALADYLIKRGHAPLNSRKYPAGLALIGTALFSVAAAYVQSNVLAIACISAAIFLLYVTSTCSWALSSIAVPPNLTASAGAMMNFGGYLGGALAPTVTGLIVQSTGSFVMALVVGAVIAVVSAFSYLVVVQSAISDAHLDQIHAAIAE